MTRLAIHHLSAGGLSHHQIAASLGDHATLEAASERSVRRILTEPPPDGAAPARQPRGGPGRPCLAEPYRHQVASVLEEEPRLQTRELLARAREWGYGGGKTAFYDLVKSLRKPAGLGAEPVVRFEGVAGEYAQFDFGERRQRFANGVSRKVVVFVGRLKYSRHVHVEVVPDQKAETLVRAVVACLEAWGCVPLIWVFDNPKTVRISKAGEPIALHPYLAGLAAECRAAVVLCTPHQPQQKGSVENGVKWVKRSFLGQRAFVDEADLQDQLRGWLKEVNETRPSQATGDIPALRLERERHLLGSDRVCPFTAAAYALRIPVTVGPTAMVHVLGTSYSVDPKRVGAPAVVHLSRETVRVVIDGAAWVHQRRDFCDAPQRLPEHRSAMLGAIYGQRKHNTYKRQCLFELGAGARDFLEAMIHRIGPSGTGWYRPVHRLFALLEEHGDEAVAAALADCHARGRHAVADVVAALRPTHRREGVA
jgi:transposase